MISGIGVSPGIAIARALRYEKQLPLEFEQRAQSADLELTIFRDACRSVIEETQALYERTLSSIGEEQAKIFVAHRMILEDPELTDAIAAAIQQDNATAAYAVAHIMDGYVALFESMEDEYMRERAADMRDIRERLLCAVLGRGSCNLGSLPGRRVIVAQDLTPSDTASMDIPNAAGIVTQGGGRTSHTAIMARALEIPAVAGVGEAIEAIEDGALLIVDGDAGKVLVNPDEATVARYEARQAEAAAQKELLNAYQGRETVTADGRKLELAANIGTPQELPAALEKGAEGIGLFRSEFLFMDRPELPTEEEQFEAYRTVVAGMGDRRVIVRTLDIGGDKRLPALELPREENPFLGYRAIRLCLDRTDLFKTQLRALLRAAIYGDLHIMLPMISCAQEIRRAKAIIEEAKKELSEEGAEYATVVPVGIMVEIPAAAIIADVLAKEVDFFSIGTNDLIQYTTATDRGNEKVADLYTPYHPAVLRLVAMTARAARDNGIFCGMCGEAAGDEKLAPVWVGMGLQELSVGPASVLRMRRKIGTLSYVECVNIAGQAADLASSEEVEAFLSRQP